MSKKDYKAALVHLEFQAKICDSEMKMFGKRSSGHYGINRDSNTYKRIKEYIEALGHKTSPMVKNLINCFAEGSVSIINLGPSTQNIVRRFEGIMQQVIFLSLEVDGITTDEESDHDDELREEAFQSRCVH